MLFAVVNHDRDGLGLNLFFDDGADLTDVVFDFIGFAAGHEFFSLFFGQAEIFEPGF